MPLGSLQRVAVGALAVGVFAPALASAPACTPELGDAPFACGAENACPSGYSCVSEVCTRDGAEVGASHLRRGVWLNAAEMYWFPEAEGATLVVNDGFSPDRRGLYEFAVGSNGRAAEPRTLLAYGDEFPRSSSVIALDDAKYAISTLQFPDSSSTDLVLTVQTASRRLAPGASDTRQQLYRDVEPFLGGTEPAYIGSVLDADGRLDVAWTRPGKGGRAEVVRLERKGSAWAKAFAVEAALPATVFPLSGDCHLWVNPDGTRTLRVGFETFATATLNLEGRLSPLVPVTPATDVPMFSWGTDELRLRREGYDDDDRSPDFGTYKASYTMTRLGAQPEDVATLDNGRIEDVLEPYVATPYAGGATVAPVSKDRSIPRIDVGWASPTEPFRVIASVERASTDSIYSARALVHDGKAYVAWTELHDALADLWIAVVPLASDPAR